MHLDFNFHMVMESCGCDPCRWVCPQEWVVSKFGRVLPVLNLRCGKGSKSRSMKYDPSKHSHNIKRLEVEPNTTSVAQLTWEVPGGDDDISKKRRGEFPLTQPWRPKRTRTEPDPARYRNPSVPTRFCSSSCVLSYSPTLVSSPCLLA